jgi:hypothetical protein
MGEERLQALLQESLSVATSQTASDQVEPISPPEEPPARTKGQPC